MNRAWWSDYWYWWLFAVAVTWLIMEVASIGIGHMEGLKSIFDYTLSDTIRRWSSARSWLAPLVVGVAAMLVWHFFAEQNPIP